jgi:hypothetical protein
MDNKWVQILAGGYAGAAAVQMVTYPLFDSAIAWPMGAYRLYGATGKFKPVLAAAAPFAGAWAALQFGPASVGPWPLVLGGGAIGIYAAMQMVGQHHNGMTGQWEQNW